MRTERPRRSRWVGVALLLAASAALLCVTCCCGVVGVYSLRVNATAGMRHGERYRGHPARECYDAVFEGMLRCPSNFLAGFPCRFRGQMTFTRCTYVCTDAAEFCEEQRADYQCRRRCDATSNPEACSFVCGQLSVPVEQYCGP